jgi:hypothetical protein
LCPKVGALSARSSSLLCCHFSAKYFSAHSDSPKNAQVSRVSREPLVWARDCRGKHTMGTRHKAARISCHDLSQCARIARLTLDGRFSNSSGIVAKRHMSGFSALYYYSQHNGCQCYATTPLGIRQSKYKNLRDSCQHGVWLCICGRQNASDTVSWQLLSMESLIRPSRWCRWHFEKRASFRNSPSAT